MSTIENIYETKRLLWTQIYTHWVAAELFSGVWWSVILFLLVAYITWWKLLDKSRLIELLLLGSLLAVMSVIVDTIADNLTFWAYKVKIFPFTPGFFPFHLTLAPVVLMIVYQYTDNWRRYLIGTVLAASIYSFVIAPLTVAIGEIELLRWNHGYTFITFIARAVLARWVVLFCKQIQASYQRRPESMHSISPLLQPALKPQTNIEDEGQGD